MGLDDRVYKATDPVVEIGKPSALLIAAVVLSLITPTAAAGVQSSGRLAASCCHQQDETAPASGAEQTSRSALTLTNL